MHCSCQYKNASKNIETGQFLLKKMKGTVLFLFLVGFASSQLGTYKNAVVPKFILFRHPGGARKSCALGTFW